jgi:hypothetical protein
MISSEWLSGRLGFCCLGLMASDWFFFSFFFFWFDFRRLDCCSFGLLISGELVPAWMYAGLGEEKSLAWILFCFSFLFFS